jgi:quercetin dioxygenase-like cupin family protein
MQKWVVVLALTGIAGISWAAQQSGDRAVILRGDSAAFSARPGAPDCATDSPAHTNPASGAATFIVKFDSGCTVPWHWHTPNENLMPISGLIQVTMKGEKPVVLKSGDFAFMPAKHIHQAKCASSKPCSFYLSVDAPFDIHYVDAAGKEIPSEQALAKVNKNVKKSPPKSNDQ